MSRISASVDATEWSDEEEDAEETNDPLRSKYVARYEAAAVDDEEDSLVSDGHPNYGSANDHHSIVAPGRLHDHRRSKLFSGSVKLKQKETPLIEDIHMISRTSTAQQSHQSRSSDEENGPFPLTRATTADDSAFFPPSFTRQNTNLTKRTDDTARTHSTTISAALTPTILRFYGEDITADVWQILLRLGAVDTTSQLVQLSAMRDIVRWFRHLKNREKSRFKNTQGFDINERGLWQELSQWDPDDWLSFNEFLQILQRHSTLRENDGEESQGSLFHPATATKEAVGYKQTHAESPSSKRRMLSEFHKAASSNRCCAHNACLPANFCAFVSTQPTTLEAKGEIGLNVPVSTADGVFHVSFLNSMFDKDRVADQRKQQLRSDISQQKTAWKRKMQLRAQGAKARGTQPKYTQFSHSTAKTDAVRRIQREIRQQRGETSPLKSAGEVDNDDTEDFTCQLQSDSSTTVEVIPVLDPIFQSTSDGESSSSMPSAIGVGKESSEEPETSSVQEIQDFFSRRDLFRLQVAYTRVLSTNDRGRLRVGDVLQVMTEAGMVHDLSQVARESWEVVQHLLVESLEQMLHLIRRLQKKEAEITGPLAHLIKYPVPLWLQQEFSAAEILLYQHHFMLIDIDGGGSIDPDELQRLLNGFCSMDGQVSLVSREEAAFIVQLFDLDGTNSLDFVEFLVLIYRLQRGTLSQAFLTSKAGALLVHALTEAKRQLHLFEEIEEVALHTPTGCNVLSFGGSPVVCVVALQVADKGDWFPDLLAQEDEEDDELEEQDDAEGQEDEADVEEDEVDVDNREAGNEGNSGTERKKALRERRRGHTATELAAQRRQQHRHRAINSAMPATSGAGVAMSALPPPIILTLNITMNDGYPYRVPEVLIKEPAVLHPLVMHALDGSGRLLHLNRLWEGRGPVHELDSFTSQQWKSLWHRQQRLHVTSSAAASADKLPRPAAWSSEEEARCKQLLKDAYYIRNLRQLLEHLQALFVTPSLVWTKQRCMHWLPTDVREICLQWQRRLQDLRQEPQQQQGENAQQPKWFTTEELSDAVTLSRIQRLPRLQQMHLSTLLVYLQDFSGEYRRLRTQMLRHQRTTY